MKRLVKLLQCNNEAIKRNKNLQCLYIKQREYEGHQTQLQERRRTWSTTSRGWRQAEVFVHPQ